MTEPTPVPDDTGGVSAGTVAGREGEPVTSTRESADPPLPDAPVADAAVTEAAANGASVTDAAVAGADRPAADGIAASVPRTGGSAPRGGHHGNGVVAEATLPSAETAAATESTDAADTTAAAHAEATDTEATDTNATYTAADNTDATGTAAVTEDVAVAADTRPAEGTGGDGSGGGGRAEADTAIKALWHEFATEPSQRVRDRLVLHYAPLVKYVAGRVGTGLPTHVDVADLIQSGIFGLVDAIEKFDPDRGLRFETYAMQRIRGAILDDLRSQDWVPRVVRSRAREVERTLERLGGRLGRTPTDAEVAAELGISLGELHDLYGQLRLTSVVALETLVAAAGRDSESVAESLPDDGAADPAAVLVDRDNRQQLADAIGHLNERDRIVVSLYYFESLTLAEIGKVLGVTESRVSQLHTRAVLRLRAKLQEQSGT